MRAARRVLEEVVAPALSLEKNGDLARWYGVSRNALLASRALLASALAPYSPALSPAVAPSLALSEVLCAAYPEHAWDLARLPLSDSERVRWDVARTRFCALAPLALIPATSTSLASWYTCPASRVRSIAGGAALLARYGPSLARALAVLYPEHVWNTAAFAHKSHGFWRGAAAAGSAAREQQRAVLAALLPALRLRALTDPAWYAVRAEDVCAAGGATLLRLFKGSVARMLTTLVPEHAWDPLHFAQRPRHTWSDVDLQRRVLQDAAQKLGVESRAAWLRVSTRALDAAAGTSGLLGAYRRSPAALLSSLYPEHAWDAALFAHKPQRYWHADAHAHARAWLLHHRTHLLGRDAADEAWYAVRRADVLRLSGGAALLAAYQGSLHTCLMSAFPEHAWDVARFTKRARPALTPLPSENVT